VFPFSEMHPNVMARLRQEILLLQNHLLNFGDALPNPNITNNQPSSSSRSVLQDRKKNRRKMVAKWCKNTCDGGVFLQPSPGIRPKANPTGQSAGSRPQADAAAVSDASQHVSHGAIG
jgi:hypothetical protein